MKWNDMKWNGIDAGSVANEIDAGSVLFPPTRHKIV